MSAPNIIVTPEVLDYVRERFRLGLAAEVRLTKNGEPRRLLLIPSTLYSEDQRRGLAIACEGEGCCIWEGINPLNIFELLCAGYSVPVASAVETLVRELFPVRRRIKRPQGQTQIHNRVMNYPQLMPSAYRRKHE